MKKIAFSLLVFCCIQTSIAQNIIQFKVSKPYCIFNFLETASKKFQNRTSPTLEKFIEDNTKNDASFEAICRDFKDIKLDYDYNRPEFPANRRQYRSIHDLVVIAAVNSNTLEEFRNRTIGILPNISHYNLLEIMKKAEVYYDKLIWNENQSKIKIQLEELEKYATKSSEIFNKLNHFYRSTWTKEVPFLVSLYPIPGSKGNSKATPHANSLCVSFFMDSKNYSGRIGIVLHEMCHVLYDEQDVKFQHQLEKYFAASQSSYKNFAHNFFDEGLATALGNGWGYKKLSGTLDSTEWYNNEYINGFGKELYPLVDEYISKNQQIDSLFVEKAINKFAKKFPNSLTDYGILMNNITLYNDAETDAERSDLTNTVFKNFIISSSNLSTPILDPISIQSIKENDKTQLIIIDKNKEKTQKELKKIFPQLKEITFQENAIYSFYDDKKRAIIILNSAGNQKTDELLKAMKAKKYFDLKQVLQK